MRRILLLIKGLGRGGAEQLLVSGAPHRDTSRFDYEVAYLLPWKDALAPDLRALGLPVHCLDGGAGLGWVGRLRAFVRERGIDVVHAHLPYAAMGARLGLRGKTWPPIVYTEHGPWSFYRSSTYWANTLTFTLNNYVFAVSDFVRDSIRYPRALDFLPIPPIETLHHGLDPLAVVQWGDSTGVREELGIPVDAPVIGTVGNFRPQKRHGVLLQAAALVRQVVPETRFVLVGTGPLEEQVKRQAKELGLEEAIIFTGFREDAPQVTGVFDVFTLSSGWEGLPIALLEAMALGKPAVVTDVGGISEVIEDGSQGLVVPLNDPRALADSLLRLLRDDALRGELGEGGRRRAADFDIRKAVRRMEEIYEKVPV